MTNAKVYQGFYDDKMLEQHWRIWWIVIRPVRLASH